MTLNTRLSIAEACTHHRAHASLVRITGTGKTATFAVSILQKIDASAAECQALVLAPTRELAQQIVKVVRALGDFMQLQVGHLEIVLFVFLFFFSLVLVSLLPVTRFLSLSPPPPFPPPRSSGLKACSAARRTCNHTAVLLRLMTQVSRVVLRTQRPHVPEGQIFSASHGLSAGLVGVPLLYLEHGRSPRRTHARTTNTTYISCLFSSSFKPLLYFAFSHHHHDIATPTPTEHNTTQVHACVGGTAVRDDIRTLQNGVHIVVGTPGRVYDMISRGALRLDRVGLFVLDEADEMLSRGFKDQIYDVFQYLPERVQVALFSATMPLDVLEVTNRFMPDPVRILVKKDELTLEGEKQT